MEQITSQVLRPGTFAVGVAVVILTFFIRRIVETVWPVLKKQAGGNEPGPTYLTRFSMWWNTVILYAIPVVLGASAAFIHSDFLHGDIKDFGGRLLFQAGVGWFSSFMYKVLRKVILNRTGVDAQPGPIEPES